MLPLILLQACFATCLCAMFNTLITLSRQLIVWYDHFNIVYHVYGTGDLNRCIVRHGGHINHHSIYSTQLIKYLSLDCLLNSHILLINSTLSCSIL